MILELDHSHAVPVVHWTDGDNRLNAPSVAAWNQVLDELEAIDGPIAAVVTGEGKFFSNGLDLDWMRAGDSDPAEFLEILHRLLGRILVFPGYLVGALNGHTFAAGAMMSLAFDARVMRTDRGYWCLPEADLALSLTDGMAAVVTAKLPRTTAHHAIITGARYSADEALAAGIVEVTAAEADVLERAVELASVMAGKDRHTLATHKRWMYGAAAARCGFAD